MERHGGQTLWTVVEFSMAVAEMLHLEAVGLILFIVEGFELVNGDLMELVEIRRHENLLVCHFLVLPFVFFIFQTESSLDPVARTESSGIPAAD